MKKYCMEFVGTFFLVSTIGHVVINGGEGGIPPLAIGAMLMAMVYAGGHISGAHYNPAVTLAVWLRGKCAASDIPGYVGAQLLAAIVAGFLVLFMKGNPAVTPMTFAGGPVVPLLAEFIGTFALAFVVLNVATAKGTEGNSYYGLAIGFTVTALAFSLGGYSGGAFNPAVAVGITVMGINSIANVWIHLAGSLAGGALAAVAFKFVNED